jgi:hypothetical protein
MTSNEIRFNSATSTFSFVVDQDLENSHTHIILLRIEVSGGYIHH